MTQRKKHAETKSRDSNRQPEHVEKSPGFWAKWKKIHWGQIVVPTLVMIGILTFLVFEITALVKTGESKDAFIGGISVGGFFISLLLGKLTNQSGSSKKFQENLLNGVAF